MIDEADKAMAAFAADLAAAKKAEPSPEAKLIVRDTGTAEQIGQFMKRLAGKATDETGSKWEFIYSAPTFSIAHDITEFKANVLCNGASRLSLNFQLYAGYIKIIARAPVPVTDIKRVETELYSGLAKFMTAIVTQR